MRTPRERIRPRAGAIALVHTPALLPEEIDPDAEIDGLTWGGALIVDDLDDSYIGNPDTDP